MIRFFFLTVLAGHVSSVTKMISTNSRTPQSPEIIPRVEIARKEMRRVGQIFKADEMGWLALGKEEDKTLFDTTQESKSWHRVRWNEVKWIKRKLTSNIDSGVPHLSCVSVSYLGLEAAVAGEQEAGKLCLCCVFVLWRRREERRFLTPYSADCDLASRSSFFTGPQCETGSGIWT